MFQKFLEANKEINRKNREKKGHLQGFYKRDNLALPKAELQLETRQLKREEKMYIQLQLIDVENLLRMIKENLRFELNFSEARTIEKLEQIQLQMLQRRGRPTADSRGLDNADFRRKQNV